MTLRLDMREAVSKANNLPSKSREAVINFLFDQINEDGGFKGRTDLSDLYYTAFGLEALLGLNADIPVERISNYLNRFDQGEDLDFVHLACLIRSRANIADFTGIPIKSEESKTFTINLHKYKSSDGAFATEVNDDTGSVYACFFALGAYQDLNVDFQSRHEVINCVNSLKMPDGGYANNPGMKLSSTPPTAAALSILHYLQESIHQDSIDWLLNRMHPTTGGFTPIAFPKNQGLPDLLSTATALHALSLAEIPIDDITEQNLDFLDSLWCSEGGFQGSLADNIIDCEYTYYGLLALGHLSS